ncbi:endonuclease III domain-containing protein [Staphylothermus hellenicus]|uniref:DNA-(Apurinic or apyrimidinic site) lyase n=1 Tax=Staphylothermus hellenicus (strain DSM 12710 / JCM 10830 / BK20S6-10-b1 / P8) TaxID=591019 RepID=D7D8T1_STAHD|nr:endonuclease III [Staphylothermus hellenicus]ADI32177.1 DNA-(apurinic or apyrimidinic site) lyase [Staphylothermus hellenicus DSM 12710]
MTQSIGEEIINILRKHYKLNLKEFIAPNIRDKSLFEYIIGVMLSQNTSDKNAIRAYFNLKKIYGEITPDKILSTPIDKLIEALKPAGMYNQRAQRIIELAKIFTEKNVEEELGKLIEEGKLREARKYLVSLPGVGLKTADVVLLMYYGQPVFPVDTHIRRVTKRLGYIGKDDYEAISSWWMKQLKPNDYLETHLLLITHGRKTCKARKPLCNICPIRKYCKYYYETKQLISRGN